VRTRIAKTAPCAAHRKSERYDGRELTSGMHRFSLLPVLALLAVGAGEHLKAAATAAPVPPAGACVRVALVPRPEHASGAAWTPDGRELVVPDPLGSGLWRYDLHGRLLGTEIGPSQSGRGWHNPVKISTLPSGFLLSEVRRLLWLDNDLRPLRSLSFPMTPQGRLDTLWSWSVAGDALYAISDIQTGNGKWRFGFVTTSLRDPSELRILREIPLEDRQEIDFYPWQNQQVASVDGVGYFLAMTASPRILAGDPPRWLRTFPAGLVRPTLPVSQGLRNLATRFSLYEQSAAPVGIYSFAHRLFLLTRHPTANRGTSWMLEQIDPRTDRLERRIVIPSNANFLAVAPGPLAWAIIEKGPMREAAEQDVHHLFLIPTARLTGKDAPSTTPIDPCS